MELATLTFPILAPVVWVGVCWWFGNRTVDASQHILSLLVW